MRPEEFKFSKKTEFDAPYYTLYSSYKKPLTLLLQKSIFENKGGFEINIPHNLVKS